MKIVVMKSVICLVVYDNGSWITQNCYKKILEQSSLRFMLHITDVDLFKRRLKSHFRLAFTQWFLLDDCITLVNMFYFCLSYNQIPNVM